MLEEDEVMPTEATLPEDGPIMTAWEQYKSSDEYADLFRWALFQEHRDGSMFAAFLAGWMAARAALRIPQARTEGDT